MVSVSVVVVQDGVGAGAEVSRWSRAGAVMINVVHFNYGRAI